MEKKEEHGVAQEWRNGMGRTLHDGMGVIAMRRGLFAHVLLGFCNDVADIKLVVPDAAKGWRWEGERVEWKRQAGEVDL